MLHHILNDLESTLLGFKVLVLDTSFDDVERCRDDEGGCCTTNRGDEVLEPGRSIVVV